MIVFPHCKINLGLEVLNKRADGYHSLSTLFYPIPLYDALEAIPAPSQSEKVTIEIFGKSVAGNTADNLIIKAYHLLDKDFNLAPTRFCLYKHIPMGAGLGGGSSNGTFALRLLNSLYGLNQTPAQIAEYAASLGSDCAFFAEDKVCLGSGRGEILEPVSFSLKGYFLVLIKPDLHISTAEAFSGIVPRGQEQGLVQDFIKLPMEEWKDLLVNDFEKSIATKFPLIQEIKTFLYQNGAVYAAMSGSGSSVFGLFKSKPGLSNPFADAFYQELELIY